MPERTVVSWNTMITGYSKQNMLPESLALVSLMHHSNVKLNETTFSISLSVCGRLHSLIIGNQVHGLVLKSGHKKFKHVGSALLYVYASCRRIEDARKVFDELTHENELSWSSMLMGYVECESMDDAKIVYDNMSEANLISCNLMIKGYAMCSRFEDSKKLFTQMPVKILSSLNTMISVYAKNGEIEKALELFETAKEEESPITWNSMISGFIQNDRHEDALRLYLAMRRSSISPTRSTYSVLLHACACLGSLQQGRVLHAHLSKSPFDENVYVGTSLIDMYSKCGSISDANTAFSYVNAPNVAAWTALINGHAHHGLGPNTISLFNLMLDNGVAPNAATFVAVLSGCARAGLVDAGMRFFRSMEEDYSVKPTLEHLTCVVDLLGRSGLLREAEEIIENTKIEVDEILLISLLHASWFWMDMELGERVVEKMYAMGPGRFSSACVIVSNMYSSSGKWREKMKVRDILREFGGKKDPGCSWIDVNNRTHVFCVDYRKHPDSDVIYANLESLNVNAHYTNEFDFFWLYK
ncbi:pentatricopeptide repeat-containing protein at2g13600 [Phtheirospermum japonicum]|uniref:Pentatricopeptide repeat-containing protein at2g13600 n=1 Tax=Phtheirospermum japonicum TaxID=374723 RepID=A0A830BZK4_9LAMI|nr:pentatricopeptide repeat-containing protein at2g13600 [Phtheirospermum japonicum]